MSEDRFEEVFRRLIAETPDPPAFSELETHQLSPARPIVFKPWMAAAGVALLVMVVMGAVGLMSGGGPDLAAPGITTTTTLAAIPDDCPVTVPTGDFTPPEGYPSVPSVPGSVWFGTDELWTVLSSDGSYLPRKSVWWSVNFPGGGVEEQPAIRTFYMLLDVDRAITITSEQGTNANTAADGWFMIATIDPNYTGCWEVSAVYKGAALSYVYYNTGGLDPSTLGIVPDVVGMTVDRARNVLRDAMYEASFFDSGDPTYEVCAQEPGAGEEINPGATIGMRTAPAGQCAELMNPVQGFNPDYQTYSDDFGRTWYLTACPNADVLLMGGVAAADGLPMIGQTWEDRVEALVSDFGDGFAATYGGSIAAVVRNGEVWDRDADGNVVVGRVADYMVEITLSDGAPCPSAPLSWNGVPVAYVLES